ERSRGRVGHLRHAVESSARRAAPGPRARADGGDAAAASPAGPRDDRRRQPAQDHRGQPSLRHRHRHRGQVPGPPRPALPDHPHAVRAEPRYRQRPDRHRDRPGARHLLRARPQRPQARRAGGDRAHPRGPRPGPHAVQLIPGPHPETVRQLSDPGGRALFRLRLRPNHLTVIGLVVSFFAAAGFIAGRTRLAGLLLILAGLFDFFDGSLARASGQVTPFGAFLDSVIDRYSDLVVLLGIVVLFARTPHARGAVIAMAGLVGSVMVSYTKARAESIGVPCNVGFMERPERMICLVAGALLDVLEPALWVLAILSNITALQRILFTRRVMSQPRVLQVALLAVLLLPALAAAGESDPSRVSRMPSAATERAWARAIAGYQQGDPGPVVADLGEGALRTPIGDHLRLIVADALARRGDVAAARAMALGAADRHASSRLAPRALLMAAALADRAGDEAGVQATLVRLLDAYPESREAPEALYLLGLSAEALGQRDNAARAYRELMVLAPTTGWADGAADRLGVLAAAGTAVPALTIDQRIDRAERLLRGGVPKTAADEAERIATEARDPSIIVRALRIVADGAQRLGRPE